MSSNQVQSTNINASCFLLLPKSKDPSTCKVRKADSSKKKHDFLFSPLVSCLQKTSDYTYTKYLNFGGGLAICQIITHVILDMNLSAPNLDTNSSGCFLKLCLCRFAIHLSFQGLFRSLKTDFFVQKKMMQIFSSW